MAGVVIGAQDATGALDAEVLGWLMDVGLPATLHRVIDVVPDWRAAIDLAVEVGIERVLTSGGCDRGACELRCCRARGTRRFVTLILWGGGR